MRVTHEIGKYIGIEVEGIERVRYNYQLANDPTPSAPKPFIHPIRLADGTEITELSPADHFWHRGLWFAWKFLNGVNYWEENQEIIGRQVTMSPPKIWQPSRTLVTMESQLIWEDDRDGATVARLTEDRLITISLIPGGLQIHWQSNQTAQEEVTLDRTPYVTWGGYGGLYVRLRQDLTQQRLLLGTMSEEYDEMAHCAGRSAKLASIEGQLHSGSGADLRFISVGFVPGETDSRLPSLFYGDAKPDYNFFGTAPLFHGPLQLKKGEQLLCGTSVFISPVSVRNANYLRDEGQEV